MYSVRGLKIGESMAVGPIMFFMSHWDELQYAPHFIWLVQGGGKTILVNTGLPQDPDDLEILNDACRSAHPQNFFATGHIWPPQDVLAEVGVKPDDVDVVLNISMQAYATGNIELFPNAEIYTSRLGWIDFLAPERPSGSSPRGSLYRRDYYLPADRSVRSAASGRERGRGPAGD